jgi:carboxyl-terminal processing protease
MHAGIRTMSSHRTSRPPIASAAILLAVVLLFGAVSFVAGLNVAEPTVAEVATPSGSESADPEASPQPTHDVEILTCAAPSDAFALLCEVYAQIESGYVDDLDDGSLVEGAVEGMVDALPDPYSGYLTPEEYAQALTDLSGEFSGIGAEVGMRNVEDESADSECTVISEVCALVIIAPLDGSPAEAAGLRAGDVVLAIDGQSTIGSTINDEVLRVRGRAGTDVTLTIRRDGDEFEVAITRRVIEIVEVSAEMLDDGVGYIELTTFSDEAAELFHAELEGLLSAGATSVVFDLRNDPGGFITTAQSVASQFLPEGELLFTVESGADVERWESDGGVATSTDIEVVVLVNGGSASASEIVAAALAENGRATLVGEPTFGKDTVQVWHELRNGAGLRLTTDRWFTPEHKSVADGGIQPDLVVAAPEDPASAEDPQLERAVDLLTAG